MKKQVAEKVEELIKKKAKEFVEESYTHPHPEDYLLIERAMLMGSTLTAIEFGKLLKRN